MRLKIEKNLGIPADRCYSKVYKPSSMDEDGTIIWYSGYTFLVVFHLCTYINLTLSIDNELFIYLHVFRT